MNMRKFLSFILMMALVVSLETAVLADSNEIKVERIDLENGDYITVVTSVEPLKERANQRSGLKRYRYYSGDELAWVYQLDAQFVYDDSTAKAISANDSYTIYDSNWSCASRNTRCSGATAYGYGYFKTSTGGHAATPTLTCSPSGTIS